MTEYVNKVREQFPLIGNFTYLDSGATSLKPISVVERVRIGMEKGYSSYELSKAKDNIANFFGCGPQNLHFTHGTTHSINYLARLLKLEEGDEIIISQMEHHANIVPWQELCRAKKAILKVAQIGSESILKIEDLKKLLSHKTKLVSFVDTSNVLGSSNPCREIVREAKKVGALTLVDGAQAAPHFRRDLLKMGCDFFVCSAHKMYGPTGVGLLYSREVIDLPSMDIFPPYILGFEESIKFLKENRSFIEEHEADLLNYGEEKFKNSKYRLIGSSNSRSIPLFSFTIAGIHPHDISTILNGNNICVRGGHMCAQPLVNSYGLPAVTRASLSFYNTRQELDLLFRCLGEAERIFNGNK